MFPEIPLLSEQDCGNGLYYVAHLGSDLELMNLSYTVDPKLKCVLHRIRHTDSSFRSNFSMMGRYNREGKIVFDIPTKQFSLLNSKGDKTGEVTAQITQPFFLPQRAAVIADMKLYSSLLKGGEELESYQTQEGNEGTYEAFYITSGEAVIAIQNISPQEEGGNLTGVEEVALTPKTLLIIPAPVLYKWKSISPQGVELRYVCEPVDNCSLFDIRQ